MPATLPHAQAPKPRHHPCLPSPSSAISRAGRVPLAQGVVSGLLSSLWLRRQQALAAYSLVLTATLGSELNPPLLHTSMTANTSPSCFTFSLPFLPNHNSQEMLC